MLKSSKVLDLLQSIDLKTSVISDRFNRSNLDVLKDFENSLSTPEAKVNSYSKESSKFSSLHEAISNLNTSIVELTKSNYKLLDGNVGEINIPLTNDDTRLLNRDEVIEPRVDLSDFSNDDNDSYMETSISKFDEIKDAIISGLSSIATSFALNSLAEKIGDYVDSVNENYRSISDNLQLNKDEIKSLRSDVSDYYNNNLSQYKGRFSQDDILESYIEVTGTMRPGADSALGISSSLTKLKLASGKDASGRDASGKDIGADAIEPIYDILKANNLDFELMDDTFNDLIRLSKQYGTSIEDLLGSIPNMESVISQSVKDESSYRKNMYAAVKSAAILDKNGLNLDSASINNALETFSSTLNMADQSKYAAIGLDTIQMQKDVRSGDTNKATADLIEAVGNTYRAHEGNLPYLDYIANQIGMSTLEMEKMANVTKADLNDMRASRDDITESRTEELDASITDRTKFSKVDEIKNKLSFSEPYNQLSDVVDSTRTDPILGAIANTLTVAIGSQLGTTLKGLGGKILKAGTKSATSAGATAAATGAGTAATTAAGSSLVGAGSKATSGIASKIASAGAGAGVLSKAAPMLTKVAKGAPVLAAVADVGVGGIKAYNKYKEGDIRGSSEEAGKGLGGAGGALGGAKLGAMIGTAGGPVGMAVGAIAGGLLGGIGGSFLGKKAGGFLHDKITGKESTGVEDTSSSITSSDNLNKLLDSNKELYNDPLGPFSRLSKNDFFNLLVDAIKSGTKSSRMSMSSSGSDYLGGSDELGSTDVPADYNLSPEAKSKLDEVLSKLPADKRALVQRVLPGAIESYKKTGVFPSVTLGQLVQESGWKGSGLMRNANNAFGIKAGSGWTGETYNIGTFEYGSGGKYNTTAAFRKYNSLDDSIIDHGKFLKENPRYAKAGVFDAKSGPEQIKAIHKAGYATDPNYTNSINKIMQSSGFLDIDKIILGDIKNVSRLSSVPSPAPQYTPIKSKAKEVSEANNNSMSKLSSTGSEEIVTALYDIYEKTSRDNEKKSNTQTKTLPAPDAKSAKINLWLDAGRQLN